MTDQIVPKLSQPAAVNSTFIDYVASQVFDLAVEQEPAIGVKENGIVIVQAYVAGVFATAPKTYSIDALVSNFLKFWFRF